MRVVIDTNIWISYLIGSLLQEIDERIVLKEIKIVVSEELLKELAEVSSRPKFKNIFTSKRINPKNAIMKKRRRACVQKKLYPVRG